MQAVPQVVLLATLAVAALDATPPKAVRTARLRSTAGARVSAWPGSVRRTLSAQPQPPSTRLQQEGSEGRLTGVLDRARLRPWYEASFLAQEPKSPRILGEAQRLSEHDRRLQHVLHVEDSVEDFELRQKPPMLTIPGQAAKETLTLQQRLGLDGVFELNPDSFKDCILIHQYAEPLEIVDAFDDDYDSLVGFLYRNATEIQSGQDPEKEVLVRPGVVSDPSDRRGGLHLSANMFAHLEGMSNPVQVIPYGMVASWSSKWKVPIAGWLCMQGEKSDSAPVLHSTPTPCVPTTLDAAGNNLDPSVDNYEVFIGSTRISFDSQDAAATFCKGYAEVIASDLGTLTWDASTLPSNLLESTGGVTVMHQLSRSIVNPSLASFIRQTGKLESPAGWTKGVKKLLVVIMDWQEGDQSLAPYSKQLPNPVPLYRDNILPRVNNAMKDMSYGQFSLDITIVPKVVRYTRQRNQMSGYGHLPFPALYHSARAALQASSDDKYLFRDYDLVFVIHPAVQPVGTKGVSWISSRGAACNGCETISDDFKVLVLVHELGHNLGLRHAASTTLDYGNPVDFMGNYPGIVGLHYGLGYIYKLGWLTDDHLFHITDASVDWINDEVTLDPFDRPVGPKAGEVFGLHISLARNNEDIYLGYRVTLPPKKRGLYVVYQDKSSAKSKLFDAACHSPTQQDSHLAKGWTFVDPSGKVAVHVVEQTDALLRLRIFRVPPGPSGFEGIRARPGFTDGRTKCPVTCEDADLLLTESCSSLRDKGYCANGVVKLDGKKWYVGMDLCPRTCGRCEEVYRTTSLEVQSSGCKDAPYKISGMTCGEIAEQDMCGLTTTAGLSVGRDICSVSCNECPSGPQEGDVSHAVYPDPPPVRQVGRGGLSAPDAFKAESGGTSATATPAPPPIQPQKVRSLCEDDMSWTDPDGNDCEVYANTIPSWGKEKTCMQHLGGMGGVHCRKTCGSCTAEAANLNSTHAGQVVMESCVDDVCVAPWKQKLGRCYQCREFAGECNSKKDGEAFRRSCPMTCGLCKKDALADIKSNESARSEDRQGSSEDCNDKSEICRGLGFAHCTSRHVASLCPRRCSLCLPNATIKAPCEDKYSIFTCRRYAGYGWCHRDDTRDSVRLQCPLTCGVCKAGDDMTAWLHRQASGELSRVGIGGRWGIPGIRSAARRSACSGGTCVSAVAAALACLFALVGTSG